MNSAVADDRFPHPAERAYAAPRPAERNVGHGHVFPRPDGRRSRCGGPALCQDCAKDLAIRDARREDHAFAVGRLRGLVSLLRGAEPVKRRTILEHLELALADLDPGDGPAATDPPPRDVRVHGRACGLHDHAHGPACAPDCPTCAGRPL